MPARSPLEMAAAHMHNASPMAFKSFIQELEKVQHDALLAVVQAPSDQILSAQGYARAYTAFLRMFKECTIERKAEQPKPQPATGPLAP